MENLKKKSSASLERVALRATRWIGSTNSILIHTAFFVSCFVLFFWGVAIDKILLVVTTLVSLEAIYLSIFIQMSMNRQARRLHAVARDVEEIQEDVEEIQEDVENIEKEETIEEKQDSITLHHIEDTLEKLMSEISELKKQNENKSKSE
jgi:uncharacterized membrane protein